MNEGEPGLVADGMEAPEFRDVDLILDAETPGDFNRRGRHIQMEGGLDAAEMRPLRHGFEVIDGLPRLDLDDALEALRAILRGEHQIRKHLANPDLDPGDLFVADVDGHIVPSLQASLEHADDPIVLQLFADRSHQDGTHGASCEK